MQKRTRVLVADEHAITRDALRTLIESGGDLHVVGAVEGARETLAAAERLAPQVVLLNVATPFGDALEAARELVQKKPEVFVVVLSAYGGLIDGALRAGARGYLTWRAGGEDLLKALREVAAGGRHIAGAFTEKVFEPSATERVILRLVAEGKSNGEMARQLRLSPRTIETYRLRLMRKLGLRDFASLVKFAIRHGIAPLD